jgi:hypothetical protein
MRQPPTQRPKTSIECDVGNTPTTSITRIADPITFTVFWNIVDWEVVEEDYSKKNRSTW